MMSSKVKICIHNKRMQVPASVLFTFLSFFFFLLFFVVIINFILWTKMNIQRVICYLLLWNRPFQTEYILNCRNTTNYGYIVNNRIPRICYKRVLIYFPLWWEEFSPFPLFNQRGIADHFQSRFHISKQNPTHTCVYDPFKKKANQINIITKIYIYEHNTL